MRGTHAHPAAHPVVLVVEGILSVRQTIQEILEEAEFLVLSAENAQQALELAQSCSEPIHLLISQPHPDDMLAPDLVLRLRMRSPDMIVLYSSANPLAALEIPDATEVISSMLPRPFSKSTLLSRINTLLAAHV